MGLIPGNPNHTFKYKTQELLETLIKNREKHKTEYDEAMKLYHEDIKIELESKIESLQDRLSKARNGELISHDIRSLSTVKPKQYLDTYDKFIKMFEMMVDDEIELDSQTFSQLVLDEWSWKHDFDNSTKLYSARLGYV
jgi:hypothetical protein